MEHSNIIDTLRLRPSTPPVTAALEEDPDAMDLPDLLDTDTDESDYMPPEASEESSSDSADCSPTSTCRCIGLRDCYRWHQMLTLGNFLS